MEQISDSSSDSEFNTYYKGHVIRKKKWKKLQNAVLQKLQEHTVLLFLIWFYDYLLVYLETPGNRIPYKYDWLNVQLG